MVVYKHPLFVITLAVSCLAITANAANIIDLLEWSLLGKEGAELRAEEDSAPPGGQRNCLCDGPSCICCVDFNLTFIDLGGPGCVRMKYISQEEFAVNISYGNSLLHSRIVKGPEPEPICMNLLNRVAQLCARITELAPTADGLRGCVLLEPTLLGEPTLEFPIGCFRSGAHGMVMEPMRTNSTEEADSAPSESEPENSETPEGLNADDIIQAVNESAEEGIAFFTNLLGLTFGKTNVTAASSLTPSTTDSNASSGDSNQQSQEVNTPSVSRSAKSFSFHSKANEV